MSSLSDVLGKLKQDEEVTFRRERDKLSIRYMRELDDGRRWAGAVFLVPEMSGYAQFDHLAMVLEVRIEVWRDELARVLSKEAEDLDLIECADVDPKSWRTRP